MKPALTWLFDLDNTLHDASHAIFPAINSNMNTFIAQVLNKAGMASDEVAVNAARIDYWRRYGATLLGMVTHHQVRPADFLNEAHRFDDLATMIRAERGLGQMLRRLPGRKILLTNAPRRYSREVLRHLGLHRHFARHVPIESMRVHGRLRPKPSAAMLRKLLAREHIVPSRCVLVEDTVGHLKSAKKLRMATVWITQYLDSRIGQASATPVVLNKSKRPGYVDVRANSVGKIFRQLHRLR